MPFFFTIQWSSSVINTNNTNTGNASIFPGEPTNNNNKSVNKPKVKPLPLVIPSDISSFAFQQQQQQQQQYFQYNNHMGNNATNATQIPYYHQMSANPSTSSSHMYPHATLLKSPRLLQNDLKKQYTPPPMLSPFRKGPGLYYKYFANMFLMPNPSALSTQLQFNTFQQQQQQLQQNLANNRPPLFNHSMSCSYIYPQQNYYNYLQANKEAQEAAFLNNNNSSNELDEGHSTNVAPVVADVADSNFKENIDVENRQKKHVESAVKSNKTMDKEDEVSMNNLKEQILVNSTENNTNNLNGQKQALKRPRLSKAYIF